MGSGSGCLRGSTFVASAHNPYSHGLASRQQLHTSIITPTTPEQHGGGIWHASCFSQRFLSTESGPEPWSDQPSHKSQLLQLGFTNLEADRVLSFYTSKHLSINIRNILAWLELLRTHHVLQPSNVIYKFPVILTSKASTAAANSAGLVEWLRSVGVVPEMQAVLLGKYPVLLNIPHATASEVGEWLRSKLVWSDSTITNMLMTLPQLFVLSSKNLDAKLAQLIAKDLRIETISKMVKAQPQLLLHNLSSLVNQTKMRYFKDVLQKEWLECWTFFTYSLVRTIGPRSAFHSLHCNGQPFNLSTRLRCKDMTFVNRLPSAGLDAECASRGMTRPQLYAKFKTSWQQGEGKKWDVGKGRKAERAKTDQLVQKVNMKMEWRG